MFTKISKILLLLMTTLVLTAGSAYAAVCYTEYTGGNGEPYTKLDTDCDGIADFVDNCPTARNGICTEADFKHCDINTDGVLSDQEFAASNQADWNRDNTGDACDDSDGDEISDYADNCRITPNPSQKDKDLDGIGDACDDGDKDGIIDIDDNCMGKYNPAQADYDKDGFGDACDPCRLDADNFCSDDVDADGVIDELDNCPEIFNPEQNDVDEDEVGDVCDNCPEVPNFDQDDDNGDGKGNACEFTVVIDPTPPVGVEYQGGKSGCNIAPDAPLTGMLAFLLPAVLFGIRRKTK